MSSEFTHEGLTLSVKHVPDYSMENGPDGNKVRIELPGKFHIGAVVDGVFVPLAAIGKARLEKHIGNLPEPEPEVQPQQTGTGTDEPQG